MLRILGTLLMSRLIASFQSLPSPWTWNIIVSSTLTFDPIGIGEFMMQKQRLWQWFGGLGSFNIWTPTKNIENVTKE
jgi:hypothetical protein